MCIDKENTIKIINEYKEMIKILEIISSIAVFGGNILLTKNLKWAAVLLVICNISYVAICWGNQILMVQNIILAIIGLSNFVKLSIKEMRNAKENNN